MKQCIYISLLAFFSLCLQFSVLGKTDSTATTPTKEIFTTIKATAPDTLTVQGKPKKHKGRLLYKTNNECYVVAIKDNSKTFWLGIISKVIKLLAGKS